MSVSRFVSLSFAWPSLSMRRVWRLLVSVFFSVFALRLICVAVLPEILWVFLPFHVFQVPHPSWFFQWLFFPWFRLVFLTLQVLHMLLFLVIRLRRGLLYGSLFLEFFSMLLLSDFLRMFLILGRLQVIFTAKVICMPVFVSVFFVLFFLSGFVGVFLVRIRVLFRVDIQSPVTNRNKGCIIFTSVQDLADTDQLHRSQACCNLTWAIFRRDSNCNSVYRPLKKLHSAPLTFLTYVEASRRNIHSFVHSVALWTKAASAPPAPVVQI